MTTIHISVRKLVEFLLRSGDIDTRRGSFSDKESMQLGSQMHRKLQRSMGGSYQAEVPLVLSVPYGEFELQVEGRADGIITEEEGCTVDEIKGIFASLSHLEKPYETHLAQAKCYAHIYMLQNHLPRIGVQMTYVNLDTEEIRRFHFSYESQELQEWFDELTEKYRRWAEFQYKWQNTRNASAQEASFPFPYREGQKDVAQSVYRTILREKKLFIQAPTGVGKTIAVVFPCIKAIGEGLADRIFYLTAKTITRTAAEKAFQVMRDDGLKFKTVTLTAKDKICFLGEPDCTPLSCPYAKGHYDRVNDAIYELLTSSDAFSREAVESCARGHEVCPFEMCLDLSEWTDGVICDYNYLFDPNAHLRRYFSENTRERYLFLIDEAHNLVDRGRSMYSAGLKKEDFLEIRRLTGERRPKLTARLSACNKTMLAWKRECDSSRVLESTGIFAIQLMNLAAEAEEFLEELEFDDYRKKLLEFYLNVRFFLNIYELADENYITYTELDESSFTVRLFCVNPAQNLSRYLEKGRSAVFFSATFLPIDYYRNLLSIDEKDYAIYAESPFESDHRLVLIGKDVTSRYTKRGAGTYRRYAEYIKAAADCRSGNYMAFFPSYQLLSDVLGCFETMKNEDVQVLEQKPNMTEEERETFLCCFEKEHDGRKSLIGFCVMGGIFAEGIDLPEDCLIGAFIIGTGLPQICTERKLLQDYFDGHNRNGFEYAYLFAGINRVLQAAGRVIRTEEDRGVVLLLDDRFSRSEYRNLFPREWKKIGTCSIKELPERLDEFWQT